MDIESWGLLGLLLAGFLSATILPFSSEAVFLVYLQLDYPVIASIACIGIGNVLGGALTFWMGRKGRDVLDKSKKWPKTEQFVVKYGALSALLSWLPFVGDPLLLFLGYFKTPTVATLVYMTLGKFARYVFIAIWFLEIYDV
jgi:membrane protein YqaA with SNARE-associated domain